MDRLNSLIRAVSHALTRVLVPELVAIVQSYTAPRPVLYILGGKGLFSGSAPEPRIEMLTVSDRRNSDGDGSVEVQSAIEDRFLCVGGGREGLCCAAVNDCIYVCGGSGAEFCAHSALSSIDPFAAANDTSDTAGWQKRFQFAAISGAAMVAVGPVLYMFGGSNANKLRISVWKFDTRSGAGYKWEILATVLTAYKLMRDACVSSDSRTVYIFGDENQPLDTASVDVFDVATEQVQSTPLTLPASMAPSACGAAIAYYRDALWLIGGSGLGDVDASGKRSVPDARRLQRPVSPAQPNGQSKPPAVAWEVDSKMQVGRKRCRVAVLDQWMLAIGGFPSSDELSFQLASETIELYDATTRRWIVQEARLSMGRQYFAVVLCQ